MSRPRFVLAAFIVAALTAIHPLAGLAEPDPPATPPAAVYAYTGPTHDRHDLERAIAAAQTDQLTRFYAWASSQLPPRPVVVRKLAPAPVYADSGGLPGGLVCIRTKESGGNYTSLSPGGTYRGAYQYSVPTWNGYGGYSDPAAAPPSVQDERALADYNRGVGQIHQNWPQTSRACGL